MESKVQSKRHSQYMRFYKIWKRMRDVKFGADSVKAAGEAYLPKLDLQTDDQYNSFKDRARFYGAFEKTISSMVGLATRKDFIIEQPSAFEPITSNVDRNGSNVAGYLKEVITEVLTVGRAATLIDYTFLDQESTLASSESQNARPYWVLYKAEDILDWRYEDGVLVYAVVREVSEEGNILTGRITNKEIFRVLEIIQDEFGNKTYIQKVYESGNPDPIAEITPIMNGSVIPFIPLVIHGTNFSLNVEKPPLMDLADACISWYKLNATLAHGLHFISLPTPWVNGITPGNEGENLPSTLGPTNIWMLPQDSQAGLLEYTGAGMDKISAELDSIKEEMSVIGIRILIPGLQENTATASILNSISETSDLSAIVLITSREANQMLNFTARWADISGSVELSIDREFMPLRLDSQTISALTSSWKEGGISQRILIDNLKRLEVVNTDYSFDDIINEIDMEISKRNMVPNQIVNENNSE